MTADQERLSQIFLPTFKKKVEALKKNGGRFVHYTTAENALRILDSETIWMRNTGCMNDFTEVTHGHRNFLRFFREIDTDRKLRAALESIHESVSNAAVSEFDQLWSDHISANTYITCVSEHLDEEDDMGRLSMWRAYGLRGVGVAIVVNNTPFVTESENPAAYSTPVNYLTDQQFDEEIYALIERIKENLDFLRSLKPEIVSNLISYWMMANVLSTKHPGFREEREWRVFYISSLHQSKMIKQSVECVNGIPQIVCKIPLANNPLNGLNGAALPDLIDRIIIGPSQFGFQLYDAFARKLEEKNVPNAYAKVHLSNIPLRN